MSAYDLILGILKSDAEDPAEHIEKLIDRVGWETVRDGVHQVLLEPSLRPHGYAATSVLWGAVLDKRPLDANYTIAVLYRHLRDSAPEPPESLASLENLVWSITSKLKDVGYLSDYEPLKDPAVQRELSRLT
jgi:hypothetical protein